jgi:hypothetical protein
MGLKRQTSSVKREGMKSHKKFLFFKLFNCAPCKRFEEDVWKLLISDKDLGHIVFEKYEWGKKLDESGNTVIYKLSPRYSFVTYGPYICIQTDKGIDTYDPKSLRTFNNVKRWILSDTSSSHLLI